LIVFFFQAEDGIRGFHVTGVQTCALPISGAFGFYMSWERLPARSAELLIHLTKEPWLLLLLINVGLLVLGMLIEGTAALILLTPILVPAVTQLGIDPLHFGLVMVVNLTLGGITPPVGTMMFTTCS